MSGTLFRFGMMLLASSLPALTSPVLEERAMCNRDNLLRCYDPTGTKATDIASRSSATAFCSSYLSIPIVTVVVATVTPVSTVTSTRTTTDATAIVTSLTTSISTTVTTSTTTWTSTSVVTITLSATVAPATTTVLKRGVLPLATVKGPSCAATTYPAASYSSACSCLSITPSTTRITTTAPVSTEVLSATSHVTTTTTTQITTTTTTTTTALATTTVTCAPPGGFCDIINFVQQCCHSADQGVGCYFPTSDPFNGVCYL